MTDSNSERSFINTRVPKAGDEKSESSSSDTDFVPHRGGRPPTFTAPELQMMLNFLEEKKGQFTSITKAAHALEPLLNRRRQESDSISNALKVAQIECKIRTIACRGRKHRHRKSGADLLRDGPVASGIRVHQLEQYKYDAKQKKGSSRSVDMQNSNELSAASATVLYSRVSQPSQRVASCDSPDRTSMDTEERGRTTLLSEDQFELSLEPSSETLSSTRIILPHDRNVANKAQSNGSTDQGFPALEAVCRNLRRRAFSAEALLLVDVHRHLLSLKQVVLQAVMNFSQTWARHIRIDRASHLARQLATVTCPESSENAERALIILCSMQHIEAVHILQALSGAALYLWIFQGLTELDRTDVADKVQYVLGCFGEAGAVLQDVAVDQLYRHKLHILKENSEGMLRQCRAFAQDLSNVLCDLVVPNTTDLSIEQWRERSSAYADLQTSLTTAFTQAYALKVDILLASNMNYSFFLPKSTDQFDDETMRWQAAGQKQHITLCVFPGCQASASVWSHPKVVQRALVV